MSTYEVEVIGNGSFDGQGRVGATITASARVEGKDQLDLVMDWAAQRGFFASFRPYHGKSAAKAIAQIVGTFDKFGVAVPAK